MAAPKFPANAHRHDPYRDFKFQIVIDGQPVAGLTKVSALHKITEVVEYREGGDPTSSRKLPGRTHGHETMTDVDIRTGRLIIEIGLATVRPAEFVVFRILQKTQEAS